MAQNTNTQAGTGSSSTTSTTVTKDSPDRHDFVDNCRHTHGYAEDRETICVICQEEMEPTDWTVTHCECQNAFHEACFDDLAQDVNAANNHNGETNPTKCPICRGEINDWPTLGCQNEESVEAEIEAARVEARRSRIEAEGQVGGTRPYWIQPRTPPNGMPYRHDLEPRPRPVAYRQLPRELAEDLLTTNDRELPEPDHTVFRRDRESASREIRERVAITQRITRPGHALPTLGDIRHVSLPGETE
jgi:hypothetical protein